MNKSRYTVRQYKGEHISQGAWYVAVASLPYESGDDWVAGDYITKAQALDALKVARNLEQRGFSDDQISDALSETSFGPTVQSEVIFPRLRAAGYGVTGTTREGIQVIPLDGRVTPEQFKQVLEN
jgi:hypothetical protein